VTSGLAQPNSVPVRAQGSRARRRALRPGWVETICLTVILGLVVVVVFGPLLAPYSPNAIDAFAISAPPSATHLLGTDDVGRDLLSRLIIGARPTLLGATLIIAMSATAGTILALIAAWFGGGVDWVVSRNLNLLFAFPGLLLAILATAVFGAGLTGPVIALSLAYTPYFGRVVRSAALRERRMAYVDAASVQGVSSTRIALRHILPNVGGLIVVQASVNFGYVVIDLAAVSFLGLGVQPPTADWGEMISEGQQAILSGTPYEVIWAGAAILITVLAVTVLGNRLASRWGYER